MQFTRIACLFYYPMETTTTVKNGKMMLKKSKKLAKQHYFRIFIHLTELVIDKHQGFARMRSALPPFLSTLKLYL